MVHHRQLNLEDLSCPKPARNRVARVQWGALCGTLCFACRAVVLADVEGKGAPSPIQPSERAAMGAARSITTPSGFPVSAPPSPPFAPPQPQNRHLTTNASGGEALYDVRILPLFADGPDLDDLRYRAPHRPRSQGLPLSYMVAVVVVLHCRNLPRVVMRPAQLFSSRSRSRSLTRACSFSCANGLHSGRTARHPSDQAAYNGKNADASVGQPGCWSIILGLGGGGRGSHCCPLRASWLGSKRR